MIAHLKGVLLDRRPGEVIVDVAGVGYQLTVSLGTYNGLGAPGETVALHVHTHVRQDTLALYGFATRRERALFGILIGVSGVGPRLAIAALSGLGADGLIEVARARDAARLASVPGIGRKTAERILLDVGDRLDLLQPDTEEAGARAPAGAEAPQVRRDVISALGNLGYNTRAASEATRRVLSAARSGAVPSFEDLLRQSLKMLSR